MQKRSRLFIKKTLSTLSPTLASKLLYRSAFGKRLDLKNPVTLNEKLMWLKLNTYYKNELVTTCVDKYRVRKYIKEKGCEEILNDLIGVWDNVEDINWDDLPNKFVLKCNHGAGYNLICTDKQKFEIRKAEIQLNTWLKEDFWKKNAEVNYKFIKKQIICEKYIETKSGFLPEDYKVYCFNGSPEYIMLCKNREKGKPKFYFLDRNWNIAPLNRDSQDVPSDFFVSKPEGIENIFKYAEILSDQFPFVRADFYLDKGNVIFGELTFTPGAALDVNRLKETDIKFGKMLKIN